MKKALFLLVLILTASVFSQSDRPFSIEGHRGARGWLPENTIPSFIKALILGADTLELDVVVSKDNKLVVSHEHWFSSIISLDKNGKPIPVDKQKDFNIFKMNYAGVRLFDVGSIGNKDFPQQEKMKTVKPLLKDVFREISKYARENKLPLPRYNIEIKSSPEGDGIYHPSPAVFAKLVYDAVKVNKMENSVIIQSFDVRPLQEMRKLAGKLPLAILVGNKDGFDKTIQKLGFNPETYSPHFSLIDTATVAACRQRGIKIIPWTVNEIADLERMKTFNLDGVITDYPDRAVRVFKKTAPFH